MGKSHLCWWLNVLEKGTRPTPNTAVPLGDGEEVDPENLTSPASLFNVMEINFGQNISGENYCEL